MKKLDISTTFQSDRLKIDLIARKDLEEVRNLHNHPDVLKYLTDIRPVSEQEQEQWFTRISNSRSNYRFIARNKETSDLVGVFRLDKLDHVNQSAQIGLDVHPTFQNKGYGTEIYGIFFKLLFNDWNLHKLTLETLASNDRARRLYAKLGMSIEGTLRQAVYRNGIYEDLFIYGVLRSEWNS